MDNNCIKYSTDEVKTIVVDTDGFKLKARNVGSFTFFVGIADNKIVNIEFPFVNLYNKLLIRAANNRTRERNYFRLLTQLLEHEITEEAFDKEIESNPDQYVVRRNESADEEDIRAALDICPHLMDVEDVDTMADVFSFSYESIRKSLEG